MLKLNRGYYYPQQRLLLSSAEAIIILNGGDYYPQQRLSLC